MMRSLPRIAFALFALSSVAQAAPINATYVGSSGTFDQEPTNYTIPANWSPVGVPNDVSGKTYDVTIAKDVFVDIPIVISQLTITSSGSLTVKDTNVAGSFGVDNDVTVDGSLLAYDSNVAVHGALTNFDSATGTLSNGSLSVTGYFQIANLQFTDANIVHNGGSITVTDMASISDQLARDGLRNFADNLASGTFVVGSGYTFVAPGNFTNAGTIEVQGPGFDPNGGEIGAAAFSVAAGHQYIQTAGTTDFQGIMQADLFDFQGGQVSLGSILTGTVTLENATLAPANPLNLGSVKITGDLTLSSGSTVLFSIPSLSSRSGDTFLNSSFDHLGVDGTVTLGQSTLAIDVAAGYPISSHATFDVLDGGAPFLGNFGNVTNGTRLRTIDGKGSFLVTDNNMAVVLSGYQTVPPRAQFANLSTRGDVLTGDNVLIGGFIIGGTAPKSIILRAIGPSLAAQNIATPLADPTLELHGPLGGLIASNDNWKDTQRNLIEATGVAPTNDLESAIVATLDPGTYTTVLQGKNGGTGTALVEIYDLALELDSTLSNISTRGFVNSVNPLIGGFIAGGSGTGDSEIVVRALGPDLVDRGIPNPLPDPMLELHDVNGTIVASNDDYVIGSDSIVTVRGLDPGSTLDAVLHVTLAPGSYTAVVFPKGTGSGVALVEFYDLFH